MKKQICFAGFGEVELEALAPSLAALGRAWDCVFLPDAASALEAMAKTPFDAVVANLTVGGIDDPQFLHESAIRHPRTLRFVLGDVAAREVVINCMGAAHQFISRPWKPAELISIIERSLALDAWLSSDKLREFIPRLGTLPGLPATYFEVLKKAESPHSSVESISEVIARDPSLTARLLQMVNSPACGLTEKITSPTEAVSRMGVESVKSLVLCLQLFSQSAPNEGASLSLDQLWHHSFSVAKFAAKIVLHCIASERMASDAYTAGLLHNIGQIVLATNLSREYSAVVEAARKRKCPLSEMEMEQLGVTSNQVGAYLLGLWGMPLPLVESTALCLKPGLAKPVEFTVLTVVHIANVLAHEEDEGVKGLLMPKLDGDYLGTLDLPKKTEAWRKLLATPPQSKAPEPETERTMRARANTTPPAPRETSAAFKKFLVFGAIATAVVAVVMLRPNFMHSLHSPTTAVVAESAPAPAEANAATAAPPAATVSTPVTGLDSIKLQSIIYTSDHPVALINGHALEVGGHFNGVEVISIAPSTVVLSFKGEQKTFHLK